ncbi:protein of unknown function [Litoreibacter ascidiaceicola]|uniref:DUF4062 domain-containing protein n=1 Tax=Litoreibacter ascidiaceicola TaxID=1486859 RepID=A0A1M4ZCY7_9RHOB|nr:DUF4062 domain-containing protein [Litoreibacter ascidiaceicola]SHF15657.1 protein of unknown function [Litoreibacter ascidiaceicola]
MVKTKTEVSVFISSTSEMDAEREICLEVIDDLNRIRGRNESFILAPLNWKRDVSSEFGAAPQQIVNSQIGDEYDIFIGFLCSRFGTPTEEYESGTQEEFERAMLRKASEPNTLGVSFFFKDPREAEAPPKARELVKIEDFRESISDQGVFKDFHDGPTFRQHVQDALSDHIDRILSSKDSISSNSARRSNSVTTHTTELVTIDQYDPDIGVLELVELTQEYASSLETIWTEIGGATQRLGEKIKVRTAELSDLPKDLNGNKDPKKVKPVLNRIAAEMDRYSVIVERSLPDLSKLARDFVVVTERAALMSSEDGLETKENIEALVSTYDYLRSTLMIAIGQVEGFQNSMSSIPRMTTRLNQARRRVETTTKQLISSMRDFETNLSLSSSSIVEEIARH